MSAPSISDGAALDAWIHDAEVAVELGHILSAEMLLALAARPRRQLSLRDGDTWYIEEWCSLRRNGERDRIPDSGPQSSLRAWHRRNETRQAQMQSLARDHLACVARARAFVEQSRSALTGERSKQLVARFGRVQRVA